MKHIILASLFVGMAASTALAQEVGDDPTLPQVDPPPVARPAKAKRGVRFTAAGGWHTGTEARFDSASVTTGSSTLGASAIFKVDSTGQLFAGAMLADEYSWGFQAGLTLEGKRQIASETILIGNTASGTTYTSSKPTVQVMLVEASALYRWGAVFLPFGLNISIPSYTAAAGSTNAVEVSPGIGAQIGVGVFVNQNLYFDLVSKAEAVRAKITSGSTTSDLKTGYLAGLALRVGYMF